MWSLTDNNKTDIVEAFNSEFRYLDDLLKETKSATMDIFRKFLFSF